MLTATPETVPVAKPRHELGPRQPAVGAWPSTVSVAGEALVARLSRAGLPHRDAERVAALAHLGG